MRISLILIAVLVLIGGAYFLTRGGGAPNLDSDNISDITGPTDIGSSSAAPSHTHTDEEHSHGTAPQGSTTPSAPLPPAIATFNYKEETQGLARLSKEWPKSKPQLLRVVMGPDLFKENKVTVEPHTANEIRQRQMGAVKVASLRVLVEKEKSKAQRLKDLAHIAQNAADETIRSIAEEARKAVENDRPFFKDTLDAISNIETAP